jgi:uncharacterized protein
MKSSVPTLPELSEPLVRDWLLAHPQFLQQHPEVLVALAPPATKHGGNVIDFQQHMLGHLQENLRGLQERYEGLIVASRDNMSTQSQVHQAVLGLVRAGDLEHLMQMITQDLVQLFDVDMVRLAMESPVAEYYAAQYGEQDSSGFAFIDPGLVDVALGEGQEIRLIADVQLEMDEALEQIFADSIGLVRSCVLLRMAMPGTGRAAVLVFGVRHAGRFHPNQGVELLQFLAQIVEYKLDQCLQREGIEEV